MAIATCGVCNIEMIPLNPMMKSDIAEWFICTNCGRTVNWPLSESRTKTSISVAREV